MTTIPCNNSKPVPSYKAIQSMILYLDNACDIGYIKLYSMFQIYTVTSCKQHTLIKTNRKHEQFLGNPAAYIQYYKLQTLSH